MPQELDALLPHHPMQDFKLDNDQVFRSLHEALFRPIRFFAGKLIPDQAAAEDIATESFIKLWQQRKEFGSVAQVKKFLYTTTKNACLNYLRDKKVHDIIHREIASRNLEWQATVEHQIIRAEWLQLVWHELNSLPPACKQVCTLLLKEGLTSKEISTRLNISPQNVDVQISVAAKRLKTAFLKRKIILLIAIFLKFFF